MESKPAVPDETQTLRRCVRELAGLSTLSAVWNGSDLRQIADGLSGVLSRSLPASLVYVRMNADHAAAVEAARTPAGPVSGSQSGAIRTILEPLLKNNGSHDTARIPDPFGDGTLRLAVMPLGYDGDCGVVVAGSQHAEFPTATDRLLLGVAVNQAAIVLQRRRSEERIRRREQELTDFFDNATLGMHWVGADGTILRANRAELSLLGYSADEYIGHHIAEFHADSDVIQDMLRRLRAGENVHDCEARMRCKDGSIKHVLVDSSVLWEDGRFVHTRCFTRDITEQKRAEDTRVRLASIVESCEDAILSIDLHGTITSWNRGAESLYGYATDEIVGKPISVLIPPDHQNDFPTIMTRLRSGERIEHYETSRLRKDGTSVDVSLTVSPIRTDDGHILGASKIARDITQRRRGEETLRRQSERLRLLWEAAGVLLAADDPQAMLRALLGKIGPHLGVDAYLNYMVNDGGDGLWLSSCEGIAAETAEQLAHLEFGQAICGTVARDRRPIVAFHIQQSVDPNAQLEKSLGVRAYACNPLLVGNRLLGTLSFASRLKDEFDAEEVSFIETICHYVTVAYERLRLLDELKAADRRKDEFLAILAHELRNPLAPILSALKVLHIKGSTAPEARGSREILSRQVEHLTRLVDDLLDVSRITRNKLELRKSRIDLSEVVTAAIESTRPLIEQCGHELTVSLPPEPIFVDGDMVRLTQVFLNLLNNAAKYTEPPGRIRLVAERHGDTVSVRVQDSGVGIARDKLPHLFEMFYQADRSLERAQSGLGLGLSLVRWLVEAHGGRVEARSGGIGKGSEFVVHLPVFVGEAESLPQGSDERSEAVATALRIVVADDNRDSADLFAMFLRLIGNEVYVAYDGVKAVEEVERVKPDAVLLDIGMPRLNGEDACRRIRATPWGSGVVLIAVTGWDQEENRRRIIEAGFDAHLVKPVDPSTVMDLLASQLRVRRHSGSAPR
jgi:PAS domain S-box-containing protein